MFACNRSSILTVYPGFNSRQCCGMSQIKYTAIEIKRTLLLYNPKFIFIIVFVHIKNFSPQNNNFDMYFHGDQVVPQYSEDEDENGSRTLVFSSLNHLTRMVAQEEFVIIILTVVPGYEMRCLRTKIVKYEYLKGKRSNI